jgi:hypothetical protein
MSPEDDEPRGKLRLVEGALLDGIVECGHCGKKLVAVEDEDGVGFYVCPSGLEEAL